MAHRGRLNVLAHVLDKSYGQILSEFKDPIAAKSLRTDLGWMGDVKYHAGARTAAPRGQMYITMPPNPSHLEPSILSRSAWRVPRERMRVDLAPRGSMATSRCRF
jgi:2-oxoglutarate dehydrogenase complex dehydrogenase (E1) component-like enzyme